MLFLLVAGLFGIIAPSWILCACGMERLEEEPALQWLVRIVGCIGVGIAVYLMFFRH